MNRNIKTQIVFKNHKIRKSKQMLLKTNLSKLYKSNKDLIQKLLKAVKMLSKLNNNQLMILYQNKWKINKQIPNQKMILIN